MMAKIVLAAIGSFGQLPTSTLQLFGTATIGTTSEGGGSQSGSTQQLQGGHYGSA